MTVAWTEEDSDEEEDYDDLAKCSYCGGEGWGIIGLDWDSDDYINGPYDGDTVVCPNCRGSGLAKDMTFWCAS